MYSIYGTYKNKLPNNDYHPQVEEIMVKRLKTFLFKRPPAKNTRSTRIRLKTEEFSNEKDIPDYIKENWKKHITKITIINNFRHQLKINSSIYDRNTRYNTTNI